MNPARLALRGALILADRIVTDGLVRVEHGRITSVEELYPGDRVTLAEGETLVEANGGYISPGFIDVHVHGGRGADFMDGTDEAFQIALAAHLRHGTTSLTPTTTVARHEQILATLDCTRRFMHRPAVNGARVLGAHFYGPYFRYEARGAHPGGPIRPPVEDEYRVYLEYADALATCTVAPELPGAREFVRACSRAGLRTNVGHSWATFEQMAEAVGWGVRHVDHLYCAMSDKSKLRQLQMFPMQGGVLEATFYFDELTTEVIADGKHLSADLLLLALKLMGPDRVALVTDANRALDMPDGRYLIGPLDGGEPFLREDDVGKTLDGKALASSVMGLDHMVRTMVRLTGRALEDVVRMASLTPARVLGRERELGSIAPGKRADLLLLDRALNVRRVWLDGQEQSIA